MRPAMSRVEVSSAPPRRSPLRALMPREHGLWCWVSAPLFGAVLLAPGAGSALCAASVFSLFGAGNAVRAQAWGPAGGAATASALLGIAALPFLDAPGLWLLALGGLVVGGAVMLEAVGRRIGRAVEGHTLYELVSIGGCVGVGAVIAVAAGASLGAAAALGLVLLAWQVIGLWWVRGQLARVLPGRAPWSAGPVVAGALVLASAAAAASAGAWLLGAVPLLYGARVATTRPVATGRDARRVGLSEAAWAAGATLAAALLAGAAA